MSILVVGESLVDIVTGADGLAATHVGGSPLNVAVGLARLGVPATLAAQVGRDRRGDAIAAHLRASGVRFAALPPVSERTSTATATLAADGSATYAFDLTWSPERLPDLEGIDALHVGSIATVLEPGAGRVIELAAAAHRRGIPVSFDPNVRLGVEPDRHTWRRAFAALSPYTTVVKLSDEDAAVLAPGVGPAELAARLTDDRRIAVVTCGAAGAYTAQGHVAGRAVDVADTIGAGDAFMAALLAWLAARGFPATPDLDALVAYAAAAATITCSRPGADPPWAAELTPTWEPTGDAA